MDHLTIRYAPKRGIPKAPCFIGEPAAYEDMPDDVAAAEDLLREHAGRKRY